MIVYNLLIVKNSVRENILAFLHVCNARMSSYIFTTETERSMTPTETERMESML